MDKENRIVQYILNILIYCDDIRILAEKESDMQQLIFIVELWCTRWRLDVNLSKTNILHVRPVGTEQSKYIFLFIKSPVYYCEYYKYL